MIHRVLIDNGSSTNILFLNALKEMKIDDSNLHRGCIVLIGCNREQKFTIGDITLPVYDGGVNIYVTFVMLDNPLAYNIILG